MVIQIKSKLPSEEISIFSRVAKLSREHDAINLGQGFPDFEVSPELKNRVNHYLSKNNDQYAAMPGILPLRKILSKKYQDAYGSALDPEENITITAGATQAIFTCIQAVVQKGDEVIIIEPSYDSYAPSIHIAGGTPIPILLRKDFSVDWEMVGRSVTDKTRYSFGKTFHATGWKMGYVIAPQALMKAYKNVHQWNVFSVNSFLQHALADHLQDPKNYTELGTFYQRKRDYFFSLMEETDFQPIPSYGSYFQLYDYSKISDLPDLAFTEWLIKEHGVATIPISPFCTQETPWKVVRFCFAKKNETLAKAVKRIQSL